MKAKYINFSPSLFETLAISDGGQMWKMLPNMLFGTFCSYLIGSYVIFEVWKWWSWWKRETDYIIFSLDNLDLSRAEEMRFIEEGLCCYRFRNEWSLSARPNIQLAVLKLCDSFYTILLCKHDLCIFNSNKSHSTAWTWMRTYSTTLFLSHSIHYFLYLNI